jgi:hypothetical protein
MRRILATLAVVGLVCAFVAIDPAFARFHRETPGGFSLWQLFIGGILILVVIASLFGGPWSTKKERAEHSQKIKEDHKREKEHKGLFRYYGEILLGLCLWPFGPFILVGLLWLLS